MKSDQLLVFDPFRLDPVNERLWRGTDLLSVRPKPFAILRHLTEHPGRLVTKEELKKAVWPKEVVGETSLKGYIRDLREVLGDDPEAPRFINEARDEPSAATALAHAPMVRGAFVGREFELKALHAHFVRALSGSRRVVLSK